MIFQIGQEGALVGILAGHADSLDKISVTLLLRPENRDPLRYDANGSWTNELGFTFGLRSLSGASAVFHDEGGWLQENDSGFAEWIRAVQTRDRILPRKRRLGLSINHA
ncbi:hypothetical protein Tco_0374163 [Tanacetum coccineum]